MLALRLRCSSVVAKTVDCVVIGRSTSHCYRFVEETFGTRAVPVVHTPV